MELKVKGMHCKSCGMLVQDALEEAGATNVEVSVDAKSQIGTVKLDTKLTKQKLAQIIGEQGEYTVM